VGVANFFCFGQNKMLNGKDYDLLRKPDLSASLSSGICTPNLNSLALIVSEISDLFIWTNGQTDMARSTRLVILIKNIYTLWGRNRFLLPVTYFPTNLVYPFTVRVTVINIICCVLNLTLNQIKF